jgi:hypothetical protein
LKADLPEAESLKRPAKAAEEDDSPTKHRNPAVVETSRVRSGPNSRKRETKSARNSAATARSRKDNHRIERRRKEKFRKDSRKDAPETDSRNKKGNSSKKDSRSRRDSSKKDNRSRRDSNKKDSSSKKDNHRKDSLRQTSLNYKTATSQDNRAGEEARTDVAMNHGI